MTCPIPTFYHRHATQSHAQGGATPTEFISLDACPEGVQHKILGHLTPRDVATFEALNKPCRDAGRSYWALPQVYPLPCHLPEGVGMAKRAAQQLAEVMADFPPDDVSDPEREIERLRTDTQRGRLAEYGLLMRLDASQWLREKNLLKILDRCEETERWTEAAVWLGRLLEQYPAQREPVSLAIFKHNHYLLWANEFLLQGRQPPVNAVDAPRDKALHDVCLALNMKSMPLAELMLSLDAGGYLCRVIPSAADVQHLCNVAVEASALASLEFLALHDKSWLAALYEAAVSLAPGGYGGVKALAVKLKLDAAGGKVCTWDTYQVLDNSWANMRIAEHMQALGLDFNYRDSAGKTYLDGVTSSSVYAFALDHGADPRAVVCDGGTTLHRIARHSGFAGLVARIVSCGVNINAQDDVGRTALHFADDWDFVRVALAAGADLSICDDHGDAAHDILLRNAAFGKKVALYMAARGSEQLS